MTLELMIGKTICGTGHRPDKLGGYGKWSEMQNYLVDQLTNILIESPPSRVISGMAQGWDTVLALAAIKLDIPLELHLPCENHSEKWPEEARKLHRDIVGLADKVIYTSLEYTKQCLQLRNISMVDNSEVVLAMWNGSSGGTKNCIVYAEKQEVPVINLWGILSLDLPEATPEPSDVELSRFNKSKEIPKFIDPNITLEDEGHIYTLATHPDKEFISCTTLLKPLFDPFEPEKVAADLISWHWKYKDRTVEDLVEEWRLTGESGTESHKELEDYIFFGKEPITPKGKQGKRWVDFIIEKDKYDWYPEVILYNKDLGIAGMIDLILVDRKTGMLHVFDWKTNKKIAFKGYRGKKGIAPQTKHMPDCEYSIYSLQLSIYKYLLENFYGFKVESLHIVHLREDSYNVIPVKYLEHEVEVILSACLPFVA